VLRQHKKYKTDENANTERWPENFHDKFRDACVRYRRNGSVVAEFYYG
jgi:hypothetical protein